MERKSDRLAHSFRPEVQAHCAMKLGRVNSTGAYDCFEIGGNLYFMNNEVCQEVYSGTSSRWR